MSGKVYCLRLELVETTTLHRDRCELQAGLLFYGMDLPTVRKTAPEVLRGLTKSIPYKNPVLYAGEFTGANITRPALPKAVFCMGTEIDSLFCATSVVDLSAHIPPPEAMPQQATA